MMRNLLVLLLGLVLFNCKNEVTKVNYLQKEEVQLVQPKIVASATVIDSFVTLKADRVLEGTTLFYTDDGSEPTKSSVQFTGEVVIKEPKELKFKAFHTSFKASEVASLKLFKKGQTASAITWITTANEKYRGSGATTLINDKKGSIDFNSPQWMGFDTTAIATVKFKTKTPIKSIDIGYLSDPGSWIFPPSEIQVMVNDNKNELFTFKLEPLTEVTDKAIMNFSVPINQEVRTLRITVKNVHKIPNWHDGKGNKAWLFMDEWIFN